MFCVGHDYKSSSHYYHPSRAWTLANNETSVTRAEVFFQLLVNREVLGEISRKGFPKYSSPKLLHVSARAWAKPTLVFYHPITYSAMKNAIVCSCKQGDSSNAWRWTLFIG